ncbi:hypothetical protein HanIR_Chr09g0408821 [Helianthus annuus]|nr:hypothetical protein HanIR_Chr09g0408821 [Helianthus annuus]KAJ0541761.1 hypothetical protein HanHA89_Chr09g0332181 [Helianthus annuus]KAJ0706837.1 hypothetical protein HanLR1_Chr09g0311631 [Helianthus annuus]
MIRHMNIRMPEVGFIAYEKNGTGMHVYMVSIRLRMRTSDSCRIEAEPGSRTRNKGIREDSRMN